MKLTSKTGLCPSPVKKIHRQEQVETIQMNAIVKPAPFILKPFAGLYNPFFRGCSLLCNHPTNNHVKDCLKKARDGWTADSNRVQEDILEVRLRDHIACSPKNVDVCIPQVGSVPEELFRRYTDTDSRPQTPAPTPASGSTRASAPRRCLTPDPGPTLERPRLVLDLRRSRSEEDLAAAPDDSSAWGGPAHKTAERDNRTFPPKNPNREPSGVQEVPSNGVNPPSRPAGGEKSVGGPGEEEMDAGDEEDVGLRRRGKRRRKKGSDASKGPTTTYRASSDPETQVATIGPESRNPSARHSMTSEHFPGVEKAREEILKRKSSAENRFDLDVRSYLDSDVLKLLRRELNEKVVDSELDYKRRKALEEALRTLVRGKPACDELLELQKELRVPPVNAVLWISLPRTFTRSSAIFQLPMDGRTLATLTPIEYLRDNVQITSARKLLYNCIFDQRKMEVDDDVDYERQLLGKELQPCLNLVMGKQLTSEQFGYFRKIAILREEEILRFKECCGIFALCERLLAPQFCKQLPDRKTDPCHEIEKADFDMLQRKLDGRLIDENLKEILLLIKTL